MKRRRFAFAIALVVLISALALSRVHSAAASDDDGTTFAFIGAKIYISPNDPPIQDGTIITRGGKIEAVGAAGSVRIPANAARLNSKGKFITAGFQNSHIHFTEPKWVEAEATS